MKRRFAILAMLLGVSATAHAEDLVPIAVLGGEHVRARNDEGHFANFASGVTLGVLAMADWDDSDDEFVIGFGMDLALLFGPEERVVLDISAEFVFTLPLTEQTLDPFLEIGLDLASVKYDQDDKQAESVIGAHAMLGLHGLADDEIYYRIGAGLHGAGMSGFAFELGVGYAFD